MAGRLLKESMAAERIVGQGGARAAAETAVMLTGGDRNVRLVHADVHPVITETEVQTDGIAVQGRAECTALYLTEEGEVRTRGTQAAFTAVIPIKGAAPKDRACVMATVSGVQAKERDGKLEMKAELLLEGMAARRTGEEAAQSVILQGDAAQKMQRLHPLLTAAQVQAKELFSENFPVQDAAYTRAVHLSAKPVLETVQVTDGALNLAGRVDTATLLAGNGPDAPTGVQRQSIPFEMEIAEDAFLSGMQVSVRLKMRDAESGVLFEPGQDGREEGFVHIEFALEADAEGRLERTYELLQDAYPLSAEPFEAVYGAVDYIAAVADSEQEKTVETTLELPADAPPISQIVGAYAAPVALDAVGGEDMRAEGLLRMTLLYRTEGREALLSYEQEVPFGVTFDRIGGLSQVYRVEIGDTEAKRISPLQAQVRTEIEMEALEVTQTRAQVMRDAEFEGEEKVLPVGAVLYYPDAQETMWDAAKRYRISEDALRRQNPEGKAPLLIYRRLTEF